MTLSNRLEYAARRFIERRERTRILAALNAPNAPDLRLDFLRMARTICAYKPKIERLLDIGAHVGAFTRAASQIWNMSTIVAVEPNSEVIEQLRSAIPKYAQLVTDAIDETAGTANYFVHPDSSMNSLVAVDNEEFDRQFGYYESTAIQSRPVRVRLLDSLFEELGADNRRNILLKIDTQGNELAILRSGRQVLAQCSVCVVEFMFWTGYKKAYDIDELVSFMKSEGFYLAGVLQPQFRSDGRASLADLLFLRS